MIKAAEDANEPGRFTAIIGYEWTSNEKGNNLHRNVIFKGAKVPSLPYNANLSRDPEDLWRAMDAWRRMIAAQGGDPDAELPVAKETHVVTAPATGTLTIPLGAARTAELPIAAQDDDEEDWRSKV